MDEPDVILKLDEVVVNRIAAGEVIQRPANALKELIENSLDAKSTNIQVVVKAGGLKFLQITDNGTGIRRDNLEIVCERFTTSKLKKYEDLETISTYGFRGEALASVSHVAHLSIQTKTQGEKCAYKASYEDGILKGAIKPCAGNQGTQITVEDLFYNVSTRKKALRSPNEEYQKVLDVVGSYAVHNSTVGFLLKKFGENTDLRTPMKSNCIDNIRIVYGNNIARELMEITLDDDVLKLTLHGYITNVNFSTKKGIMLLFINHRLVESASIKKAIDTVYATYLPKGGHSFLYLSLQLDPSNVDVNVHPTKHEVHFLHEEQIVEKIKLVVEAKLLSCNTSRVLYTQTRLPGATIPNITEYEDKPNSSYNPKYLVRTDSNDQKIDKFFGLTTSRKDDTITENVENIEDSKQCIEIIEPMDCNELEESVTINEEILDCNLDFEEVKEKKIVAPIIKSPKTFSNVMTSTPGHLSYIDPKESFKTRQFYEQRNETRLTSVKLLRTEVEGKCNAFLREMLANLVFIGVIDESKALIQHSTKMYLCNSEKLMEELFYEILLYDFQNFGFMKFASPLSIYDLAMLALDLPDTGWSPEDGEKSDLANSVKSLLISKAPMLLEYFSMEIDAEGNLISLPLLLENYTPFMGALPLYILQLATEVNWEDEKQCFRTFSRQTAIFYSQQKVNVDEEGMKALKWTQEHVVYSAIRKYFLPPKEFLENGVVLQIANLPDLYKVFERC